jgi:hypothetical protein
MNVSVTRKANHDQIVFVVSSSVSPFSNVVNLEFRGSKRRQTQQCRPHSTIILLTRSVEISAICMVRIRENFSGFYPSADPGVFTVLVSSGFSFEAVEADPKYEQSDRVKQLSESLANWEIAEQLGIQPSRVTLLFNFWFERRGLHVPGPEGRRKRKPRTMARYKEIAEVAKQRWEKGDSESEIGRDFKTTQATVREAIAWWHESRNLAVPRFKDRRQVQVDLAGSMRKAGSTLAEISAKMERTITTVRKLLDDWYAAKGQVRPDGRTERHRRTETG